MTFQNSADLGSFEYRTLCTVRSAVCSAWLAKGEMSCHKFPLATWPSKVFINLLAWLLLCLCIHWMNTIGNEWKKILGGGNVYCRFFSNWVAYRHDGLVTFFVAVSCTFVFVFSFQVSDAFFQSRGKRDVFCLPWIRCSEERRTL
jgi:hypothetical protein